jgi:hypothetical protein
MPTLGWELTSVSNASETGPSGTFGTELLQFLLANAFSRLPRDIGKRRLSGGLKSRA